MSDIKKKISNQQKKGSWVKKRQCLHTVLSIRSTIPNQGDKAMGKM